LREAGKWNLRACDNNSIFMQLGSEESWKMYICRYLKSESLNTIFSESPEEI